MPETCIPVTAITGTWTKEEIRRQPASWIRPLTNIDNIRSATGSFLAPLLHKNSLRIILTETGISAFIDDIVASWLTSYTGKDISAVPITDLVTNPMDYLGPAHPLLLTSFTRSSNSPKSVAAVELTSQFVPERYHLPITCDEADSLYQDAVASDNAFALLMPAETYDRGFVMTSSITTIMASYLAVLAPEKINSQTFRDVAGRCQIILTSLGDFSDNAFGNESWRRIVYLGNDGLQGAARESTLKVLELIAGKLTAFYDPPTGSRHGPESLVNNEALVVVFVSSHPCTRQYDLDLLAELRRGRQALRVVAIAAQTHEIIGIGPHILLPPARSFIDMELAFCFLVYAQVFALTQSISIGNTPDTPSASSAMNRAVQGVVIHPWNAQKDRFMSIISAKYLLLDAQRKSHAVPAFNIHNVEAIQVILEVCSEMQLPVILAGTPGTLKHIALEEIYALYSAYSTSYDIPLVLHLDHHESLGDIRRKVNAGVRSAVIGGGHFPFEENVKLMKSVANFCHAKDCSVETGLGRLGGAEDGMSVDAESAFPTDPREAKRFIERTGVDSLAVATDTAHDLYIKTPRTGFQRLGEIREVVDVPLMLHGASDIPNEYVRRAIELGVCRVSIATELKIAFADAVKAWSTEGPQGNDPRCYMWVSMDAMKEVVCSKITTCGSANRLLTSETATQS